MASENSVCKTTITPTGVQLDFANGVQLTCNVNDLPAEVVAQAALFGIRRKVTNSFADAKGNVDDALKWAKETWEQLQLGMWTAPRETTGASKPATDLLEAIIQLTGKPADVVAAKLDAMTKEDRANLRKNSAVAAKLLEIRAERERAKATAKPISLGEMFQ